MLKSQPTTPRSRWRRLIRNSSLFVSTLLLVCVTLCYYCQPDALSIITIWPTWTWLIPGLLFLALGWGRLRKRYFLIVALLWAAYLSIFVEESRSLVRFAPLSEAEWQTARTRREALRVISLNCAGGSARAANEVSEYRPDIVLLQESPDQESVKKLARVLFGDDGQFLWTIDLAIIARGQVSPSHSSTLHFAQVRVRLSSGFEIEVVNTRLMPLSLNLALWSPNAWKEHREIRQIHRRQMQQITQQLGHLPADSPLLVAGDFNAPAGDAVFSLLQPRLYDTFKRGGIGWGNTVMNDVPLLRFDQVWASDHFHSPMVRAVKTQHSDHRMVICDLLFRGSP